MHSDAHAVSHLPLHVHIARGQEKTVAALLLLIGPAPLRTIQWESFGPLSYIIFRWHAIKSTCKGKLHLCLYRSHGKARDQKHTGPSLWLQTTNPDLSCDCDVFLTVFTQDVRTNSIYIYMTHFGSEPDVTYIKRAWLATELENTGRVVRGNQTRG